MARKRAGFLLIILTICSFNILSQDNTNNKMQDKSSTDNNNSDKMIEKNANYYTNSLDSKLNLTKSQIKYIHNILYSYYSNETEGQTSQLAALREKPESLNMEQDPLMPDSRNIRVNNYEDKQVNVHEYPLSEIETILDQAQRDTWIIMKDAWWLNAKSALSNSTEGGGENDIQNVKREYEDSRDYENYDVYDPGYDVK